MSGGNKKGEFNWFRVWKRLELAAKKVSSNQIGVNVVGFCAFEIINHMIACHNFRNLFTWVKSSFFFFLLDRTEKYFNLVFTLKKPTLQIETYDSLPIARNEKSFQVAIVRVIEGKIIEKTN